MSNRPTSAGSSSTSCARTRVRTRSSRLEKFIVSPFGLRCSAALPGEGASKQCSRLDRGSHFSVVQNRRTRNRARPNTPPAEPPDPFNEMGAAIRQHACVTGLGRIAGCRLWGPVSRIARILMRRRTQRRDLLRDRPGPPGRSTHSRSGPPSRLVCRRSLCTASGTARPDRARLRPCRTTPRFHSRLSSPEQVGP